MRSLAPNREVATMAEAPVRTHVHHSFNIHLHVTPQITFNGAICIYMLPYRQNFSVRKLVNPARCINFYSSTYFFGR
jgi:hypothetical protein